MAKRARTRVTGIQDELIPILQDNSNRILTIGELMQLHPQGTTLQRSQVSSAMSALFNRGLLPKLQRGKARGTWIYAAANTPEAAPTFQAVLLEVLPTAQGTFIGVDRDNARVYKMEQIA